MDHINMSKHSPAQRDSPKPPNPTTVVLTNRRYPPLEVGHYTKIGGMWNLKHEISDRNGSWYFQTIGTAYPSVGSR